MDYRPLYPPQHTSKCYCKHACSCLTPVPSARKPRKDFVRTRSVSGNRKPPCGKCSIQESISTTRSPSKCSAHSLAGLSSQSSNSFVSQASSKLSGLHLTDRRLQYETIKTSFHSAESQEVSLARAKVPEELIKRSSQEVVELCDFRLDNSEECFGSTSQNSVLYRLKKRAEHLCGLLEPPLVNEAGQIVCRECHKVLSFVNVKKEWVPLHTESSKQKIVEVKKNDTPAPVTSKKQRLKPPLPLKSLVFAYHERLW